ncbi:hypothetical protein [Polaromonas eurypsychrophila]|uniref:Uncharacterized protein n=1 Tax=Polaromonas eurypsychrophila TaxID=1614635 RepID=A0A916WHV2_9BURK|nr:hypothetical protein [Polaromonas eurypsychrophila]GGA99239.1 hypothetical protein GCM10011496_20420 [Polaromonas eurypsychrophila]
MPVRFNLTPAFVFASVLAVLVGPAQAEVTFNAGAKLSHDNNVNGSPDTPTKANQLSDNYLTLSTSAVYFTPLDDAQTRYFIGQIGALSSAYQKFNALNSSMLVASAGLYQQLSPTWSGQVTARGFTRYTRQTASDSKGFGGTLEIKKQLSPTVFVKAFGDYEDSKANLSGYSYTGETYGVNLGYLPLKDTFVNLGYSHATRDFKSATLFVSKSETLFAEVTQRVAKNWYLSGGYAYGRNDSNLAGTAYTNHTVSVGLNFSY